MISISAPGLTPSLRSFVAPVNRSLARFQLLVAVLVTALSSCGGDAATNAVTPTSPGPHILTTRTWEDTIEAFAPSRLTVEVRDAGGKPVGGARVTFDSHRDDSYPHLAPLAQFFPSTGGPGMPTLMVVTDARGQATVDAQLGVREASGWITLNAAPRGRDSIRATARPGAPARLFLTPRDTALKVGASYALTAVVRDRPGDSLGSVSPTLVVRRSQVAATSGGLTVRTSSTGRTFVVGTVGTGVDSVALEVVPSGTLVAFRLLTSNAYPPTVATFDLDGSNFQRTLIPSFGFNNFSPHWLPQRSLLVFHSRTTGSLQVGLFTMDVPNQPTPLYVPATGGDVTNPQPSRDGAWIYYTLQVGSQSAEIWRMDADGSGRVRVGPVAGYYDWYAQPTPSPDGSSLVYAQTTFISTGNVIQLIRLDLATGASTALGAFGTHPAWSPVAPEIAYLTPDAVRLVQADGTGDRVLAASQQYAFDAGDGQLDWSPDGKWLVACALYQYGGDRRVVLIERATGDVLPLAFTYSDNLCEATWKR